MFAVKKIIFPLKVLCEVRVCCFNPSCYRLPPLSLSVHNYPNTCLGTLKNLKWRMIQVWMKEKHFVNGTAVIIRAGNFIRNY